VSIRSPLLLLIRWRVGRVCIRVSTHCINRVKPVIEPSTTEHRYAQKCLSFCTVSRVTLWNPIGRCLSQSWNLKRIALRAKFEACKLYDVVCLLLWWTMRVFCDMFGRTRRMRPTTTTRSLRSCGLHVMLSWSSASVRIGTRHLASRGLSFCWWTLWSLRSVLLSQASWLSI
jgi:hypothetical protein